MAIEVEFITLGEVASRLERPAPTLRHWTDQLEEYGVHYVLRNNRNERIYEESDIEVFKYLSDLKNEHGRKTTSKDLSYLILEKGRSGELKLRTREEAPPPSPSNRQTDLINQEDIKKIFESDRARQVLNYMVTEATTAIKEDLLADIREELLENKTHNQLVLEEIEKRRIEREEERERKAEERQKYIEEREKMREERDRKARIEWEQKQEQENAELRRIIEEMKQTQSQSTEEKPKGFFAKFFGK